MMTHRIMSVVLVVFVALGLQACTVVKVVDLARLILNHRIIKLDEVSEVQKYCATRIKA